MAREGGLTGVTGGKEQKVARGRGKRLSAWLRANAMPLISLGLITAATATTFLTMGERQNGPAVLFKKGIVGSERLSLNEKMIGWKYMLTREGKCARDDNYDSIIREMQDEVFECMRRGDKESADKIWHAMETFMAIRISSVEDGDCARAGNGAKAGK